MIDVLVVDDSPVARSLIAHVLNADPGIRVVGTASSGEEAIEAVARNQPDVITMDILMPNMDGLEATRQIMQNHPTPIVIVSALVDGKAADVTFQAMEAGALAVLARPQGLGHPDYAASCAELVRTVKLMSEVKVVRRWARYRGMTSAPLNTGQLVTEPLARPESSAAAKSPGAVVRLVAIGASTGGPPVVRGILAGLPPNFSAPIVIVQHMAVGFIQGFVDWLAGAAGYPVLIPRDGDHLLPGTAYVAPEGKHLGIEPDVRAALRAGPPEHSMRPAVSYLFRSVAQSLGPDALGVLLTGMGKDGAAELKLMRDAGAITIAQDADSSIVHGMPGEAIALGGATYVRPADKIGSLVRQLVQSGDSR
jgi:two-component system, chemotaxis family, protein-glutamate methylesterase/glutaminase